MAYFDTLEYVDGSNATQEVALRLANVATDGAVSLTFTPASHAPSTMRIAWALPPETALVIPFRSRCKIRINRSSTDGAANSFSGGTILFQGRRTDNNGAASGNRVMTEVTLSDVWWDFLHVTYTLPWKYISGGTVGSPTYSTYNFPDVVLFQADPAITYSPAAVNGTITTFQQLKAVMDFCASFGSGSDEIQVQMSGTPEFTPAYVNWYPIRAAKVAEVIDICLRPHPAVFTEVDYSTTPPTIHFRNRAAMTAVNLPYKSTDADGIAHLASDIQPLNELVPDTVRLFYKINGTFNGQPVVNYSSDAYPTGNNKLLALDFSIDITGASTQETRVAFNSTAFDPTSKTLWRQRVASLRQLSEGGQIPNDGGANALAFVDANPYDAATHPKGIQIVGEDGTDYSANYGTVLPYITDSPVYTWMKLSGGAAVTAVKATVKAFFSYGKISPQAGSSVTDTYAEHQHSFKVLLTDAPSGTYVLRQTTSAGENIPSGLAQKIYNELQTLQWRLNHEIFQVAATTSSAPLLVKPGLHKINLVGGASAWETMDAAPERVSIQLFRTGDGRLAAQTRLSCGPVNHLEPGYLVQLHNLFWNRNRSTIDAGSRFNAQASNQVDLSNTAPKENSVTAPPVPIATNHVYVASGAIAGHVQHDSKEIANILAATTPTPVISTTEMVKQKPREVAICDNQGNFFYAIAQITGGHTK